MSTIRKVNIDDPMSEGDISVDIGWFDRSQRFRVSEDVVVSPVLIRKIIAIFGAMKHVWAVDADAVLTIDTSNEWPGTDKAAHPFSMIEIKLDGSCVITLYDDTTEGRIGIAGTFMLCKGDCL